MVLLLVSGQLFNLLPPPVSPVLCLVCAEHYYCNTVRAPTVDKHKHQPLALVKATLSADRLMLVNHMHIG